MMKSKLFWKWKCDATSKMSDMFGKKKCRRFVLYVQVVNMLTRKQTIIYYDDEYQMLRAAKWSF